MVAMSLDFNSRDSKADRFVDLIDAAMRAREEAPREYLGASAIGETCARRLQYEFQGAPKDEGSEFSPKTLRIFHRGHSGEDWMVTGFAVHCVDDGVTRRYNKTLQGTDHAV